MQDIILEYRYGGLQLLHINVFIDRLLLIILDELQMPQFAILLFFDIYEDLSRVLLENIAEQFCEQNLFRLL